MTDVALSRPRFSPTAAAQLATDLYGRIPTTIRSLPSDRDQNFYLETAAKQQFVLKIASAAEDEAVLDFQNQVLARMQQQPELAAYFPQLCLSKDGQEMAVVEDVNGRSHLVRLLTYLPGIPLAKVNPHTPQLLAEYGRFLGRMDAALQDFMHPAMQRDLHWDLAQAGRIIRQHRSDVRDPQQRALVDAFLNQFEEQVTPQLPHLRRSVIHNDGNDYNVLVSADKKAPRQIAGLIDFGDMLYTCTIFELAIACAYVMLDKTDPLAAAAQVVAGFHSAHPLTPQEVGLLYTLITARLCTSVTLSAYQRAQEPDNAYLSISAQPAWALLHKLADAPPQLAHFIFRRACGWAPYPHENELIATLQSLSPAPLLPVNLPTANARVFDWSVGSLELGSPADFGQPRRAAREIFAKLEAAGTAVGVGRYNEARMVYSAPSFQTGGSEWRTIHIGLDLFMPPGTAVSAPLDGVVHSLQDNNLPLDYGPTIILQHTTDHGLTFYTLYGHLSRDSLDGLSPGTAVTKGQPIARIGDVNVNGGWAPHLHFQIMGDLLGRAGEFPGVAPHSQRDVWLSLCPDPNLLLGIPAERFPPPLLSKQEILDRRRSHLGKSLSISYQKPLKIVRGWQQYLYDENGRAYLDVVNNVCHVGHSHPRVVKALGEQAAVLNTNTRYLHDNIVLYAQRLLATLPDPLSVCFFVCSGSEANELALRLARTHTNAEDMLTIDGAYHGNTAALIDISPYKHDGRGGKGAPPHVHKLLMPDPYRGQYKGYGAETGAQYAQHARDTIAALDRPLAGFIAESVLGCGGQIVLPEGYLQETFTAVRAAGGVCIADEVQVGFGRLGTHFWGFETQGAVPDIVTMGKPIGNGHPLAAVVTTPQIAASFANGMEYFNTFGGNPVSCAVGVAVLDVIAEEELQANALHTGKRLLANLTALMDKHPLIGDVRGVGLFVGIELVRSRETLEPAAAEASYIVERIKEQGILLSIDGPLHNVLKLKPPLVFNAANADFLAATLDRVLAEDAVRVAG